MPLTKGIYGNQKGSKEGSKEGARETISSEKGSG
jgi:hypothetical protein